MVGEFPMKWTFVISPLDQWMISPCFWIDQDTVIRQ